MAIIDVILQDGTVAEVTVVNNIIDLEGIPLPIPSNTGSGGNLFVNFTYADLISIVNIGQLLVNTRAFVVCLSITEAFDNELTMSVGTDENNNLFANYNAAECSSVIELRNPINISTNNIIKLFPFYTTAPTTGTANLSIFYL